MTPFPYEQVEQVVESELGLPIEKLFVEFSERPIAAASIGQVHEAVLPNGRRVAVKVQRPNAPRQIEADLVAPLPGGARSRRSASARLDFVDARGARGRVRPLDPAGARLPQRGPKRADLPPQLRRAPARPRPEGVSGATRGARVLTLEYLEGMQVADVDTEEYTLEERRRLAYLMTEAWMTMIFRHGFFHGDPHPANVLVLGSPERIGLVDFGLAGKLSDDDMSKLTRLFIDAANENVEALPKRLADLGVRYDKSREDEFVAHIRELYDRYYGVAPRRDRPDAADPRGLPAHLRA